MSGKPGRRSRYDWTLGLQMWVDRAPRRDIARALGCTYNALEYHVRDWPPRGKVPRAKETYPRAPWGSTAVAPPRRPPQRSEPDAYRPKDFTRWRCQECYALSDTDRCVHGHTRSAPPRTSEAA